MEVDGHSSASSADDLRQLALGPVDVSPEMMALEQETCHVVAMFYLKNNASMF